MTRRLLAALFAFAAVAACSGSTAPQAGSSQSGSAGQAQATASASPAVSGQTVNFKETEYSIAPSTLTLKPGTYTFVTTDVGQFPHDLHLATADGATEIAYTKVVTAGQSASFRATLQPGTYVVWCAVDSHKSLGMQGTITVQ